jgi:hypothetical protein
VVPQIVEGLAKPQMGQYRVSLRYHDLPNIAILISDFRDAEDPMVDVFEVKQPVSNLEVAKVLGRLQNLLKE